MKWIKYDQYGFYILVGIFSSPFSFVYGVNEHILGDRVFFTHPVDGIDLYHVDIN